MQAALLEGMGEYHDIWSQRSHDSHYMPVVGPIAPLAVLGTSLSAWCSSKTLGQSDMMEKHIHTIHSSIFWFVLIKWFVMFEHTTDA